MNRTLIMLIALMFGVTAITATAANIDDNLPGLAAQPASYFYTGKPYDADLGAYVFAFRNFDPELTRWTTPDPSGFPDGANGWFYRPIPTSQLDSLGLFRSDGTVYDGYLLDMVAASFAPGVFNSEQFYFSERLVAHKIGGTT